MRFVILNTDYHEFLRWIKNMRFQPYSRRIVWHTREWKIYFCKLYRPHILAEAINIRFPSLATFYAVNIGAGDGKSANDPVYPLFKKGFAGLAVEGRDNQELFKNLLSDKVKKLTGVFVTPQNTSMILNSSGCPKECDFLKIDIDGYDGVILNTILESGYRPKVIQMEINPEFPPPIEFSVLYHPGYQTHDKKGRLGGFYGASLSYVINITKDYGYKLAYIDFVTKWTSDVTLVKEEFFDVAIDIFGHDIKTKSQREFYLSHPPGYYNFMEYGIDSFAWRYRIDYHSLLLDIRNACLTANAIKHGNLSVPFHLSLGIIDSDLQHPPEILPALQRKIRSGAEVVIALRYVEGGGSEGWSIKRKIISKGSKVLAGISLIIVIVDPVSCFFLLRRKVIDGVKLVRLGIRFF